MQDTEKGENPQTTGRVPASDRTEEAWASKLWSVYISEAEKYDRALVDSWKSDMEGLVIFAALFSAILTAFIIESYRTLIPDSGDQTVQLLAQISQQLQALSNASALHETVTRPLAFTPPTTSLVCNALWFMSLGLSLACALIATLVQQWARDFLHRAEIHSAPLVRARIFSYLYYGLRSFRMHAVVELVPLLLHISLLLFFGGLVAFFLPVNELITAIAGGLFLVVGVVYVALTMMPLLYLSCPYRTPLSSLFWNLLQASESFLRQYRAHGSGGNSTMIKSMAYAATKYSEERTSRDYRALVWTLKSSIEDVEFEPFIEAIPHLLWGPNGRRFAYEVHIQRLANNAEIGLQHRILALLNSCDSGTLSTDARQRRRIVSLKALWALGSIASPTQTTSDSLVAIPLDASLAIYQDEAALPGFKLFDPFTPEIRRHLPSAWAMIRWRAFCAVRGRLIELRQSLLDCEIELREGRQSNLRLVSSDIGQIAVDVFRFRPRDVPELSSPSVSDLKELVTRWLDGFPYRILFDFLSQAALLESSQYRGTETAGVLALDDTVAFSVFETDLESALSRVYKHVTASEHFQPNPPGGAKDTRSFDENMVELLSYWRPSDYVPIPMPIIQLINQLQPDSRLSTITGGKSIAFHLWSNFPATILAKPPFVGLDHSLTALWRFASLHPAATSQKMSKFSLVTQLEAVLNALSAVEPHVYPIVNSIVALIKNYILNVHNLHEFVLRRIHEHVDGDEDAHLSPMLGTNGLAKHVLAAFHLSIFPLSTGIPFPTESVLPKTTRRLLDVDWGMYAECLNHRKNEARLVILTEFLEHCHANYSAAFKPIETLEKINKQSCSPTSPIHPTHQYRLARIVQAIISASRSTELTGAVLMLYCWQVYVEAAEQEEIEPSTSWSPWLDDPAARSLLTQTLSEHCKTLESGLISEHARKILKGLDALHSTDTSCTTEEVYDVIS